MQGGLSMVAKHHSKANHLALTDYDSSRPCRFLMFLDANNLYGKAMMDFLPVGGFRWMMREELMVEFICSLPDEVVLLTAHCFTPRLFMMFMMITPWHL